MSEVRPPSAAHPRLILPSLILVLLLVAVLSVFRVLRLAEEEGVHAQVREKGAERAGAVSARLAADLEALSSVRDLFHASRSVEEDEFRCFAEGIRDRLPEVESFAWRPRADGMALEDGLAVVFLDPPGAGIDVEPLGGEAVSAAMSEGTTIFHPAREGAVAHLRFALAVRGGTDPSALSVGLVTVVLDKAALLAEATRGLPPVPMGLDLIESSDLLGEPGPGEYRKSLRRGGGRLVVRCVLAPEFLSSARSRSSWIVLGSGLLLVGALVAYIARLAREAARVESLVRERTAALQESEGRLAGVLANTPAVVTVKDLDGRLLMVNHAFVVVVGRGLEQVLGQRDDDLFPEAVARRFREQDRQVAHSNAAQEFEDTLEVGGASRTYLTVKFPLCDARGRIHAVCAIGTDITERKRFQEETIADYNRRLAAALEEVRRAQQQIVREERLHALGEMASGIAHDFNNALAPILGFSELMVKGKEDPKDTAIVLEFFQLIHTSAKDAAQVVRRLTEFYRRRGTGEPLTPMEPQVVVEEVVRLTEPKWKTEARARGATIDVSIDAGATPWIEADLSGLREALTNLVMNAVDAMPSGGTLRFRTSTSELHYEAEGSTVPAGHAVIEVIDNGAGMPEQVRLRCLEPFFTTKGVRGTGLGLAMVYGFVRRHGGAIEVESAPGRGTTVRLRMPALRAPSEEAPAVLPRKVERLRILLVDDDPQVLRVHRRYLDSDGHTVTTAASGQEALQRFDSAPFDVVLTDSAMPEMNGAQLARAIRDRRPDQRIVLVTGLGDLLEARSEVPECVDCVLSKPVTLESLRAVLAEAAG